MIHLEPEQKDALQERARERGSSMAAEIRNAVDQYLSGATTEELAALEVLSKSAEKELQRMSRRLDQTNAKLDRVFKTMERLHKQKAAA
jgi:flagellar capping protein FliD